MLSEESDWEACGLAMLDLFANFADDNGSAFSVMMDAIVRLVGPVCV